MSSDVQKLSEAAQAVSKAAAGMRKHFGDDDHRKWSETHGPPDTQEVHGNRPGRRTQEGVLATKDLTPPDWHRLSPREQTDYFLRATGYSTPVVSLEGGKEHYLAPPGAKMLPERGAGENVDASGSDSLEPNTQLGQGLDEQDKLDVPENPEEQKRFLEAAAEHRQNDYQGPTTPHFEERWGDQLRSQHPKRAPKGPSAPAARQESALREARGARKGPQLRRLGRHRDEAVLAVNLLQNATQALGGLSEAGRQVAQSVAGARHPTPPGRRGTTAEEETTAAADDAPAESEASQEASETAEQNAQRQRQRAAARRRAGARLPVRERLPEG